MTDLPIRLGLVGTGKIAQMMHLPFIEELPGVEVVACADISAGTMNMVADRFGIPGRYTDNSALIADPQVDAVLICNFDHPDVAESAIRAGKHVLIEKPLAFTLAEARKLAELAAASGVTAMVGYMKLYDAGTEAAATALAGIGPLRTVHVHDFAGRFDVADGLYRLERADDVPPEALLAGRRAVEAKVAAELGESHAGYRDLMIRMLMIGSHDLAVMRHLLGRPERVAYARPVSDFQTLAVLEFPGGVPCVLELAIGAKYNHWDESLTAYGERDEIRVEFAHPYHRYGATMLRCRGGDRESPVETVTAVSNEPAFKRELRDFVACIREGRAVTSTLEGAAEDVQLMQEIILAMPPRPATGV